MQDNQSGDTAPTVFVVDDEALIRDSLAKMLKSAGFESELFGSGKAFLENYQGDRPGCVIIDLKMKGMSGLKLLENLQKLSIHLPVIFLSGVANIQNAVEAMKAGAVDFLEKPFRPKQLLEKVRYALSLDVEMRLRREIHSRVNQLIDRLSPREHQVMELLIQGKSSKAIAQEFNISPKTIDIHRARVLEKMEVGSVVLLVQLLHQLDL